MLLSMAVLYVEVITIYAGEGGALFKHFFNTNLVRMSGATLQSCKILQGTKYSRT